MSNCKTCEKELPADSTGPFCARCVLEEMLVADRLPEDSAEPDLLSGNGERVFGDYVIIEEIARGGMGAVFKARQLSLNRVVAIKVVLGGVLATEKAVKRFQTEAEAIAKLDHPNIVPIYEFGQHAGQHFFSMRYVAGGSLADRIGEFTADAEKLAALIGKLARAVQYAHERGILHRDLKPQNILLDAGGEPFITDFGLAKLVENDPQLTATKDVFGTPSFMAPEQAAGHHEAVCERTDVYGLGALLYHLLTGAPPFRGRTSLEVIKQVVETEPVHPSQVKPNLDPDLAIICLQCLQKNSERRYASAQALADDLDRWAEGLPILARPDDPIYRLGKWTRRHAGRLAVSGSLLAMALIALLAVMEPDPMHRIADPGFMVTGLGHLVGDGARKSAKANGTTFGDVRSLTAEAVTNFFQIRNYGSNALSLGTGKNVQFSGPNAADFSVAKFPDEAVPPGGAGLLGIRFQPRGIGVRRAQIAIPGAGEPESAYSFGLRGNGIGKPGVIAAQFKARLDDQSLGSTNHLEVEARFGSSLAAIGDVNGDGVTDLVVGLPGSSGLEFSDGGVWVVFLDRNGQPIGGRKIDSRSGAFTGLLKSQAAFGSGLAAPGDLDGDEIPDLLVTAPGDVSTNQQTGAIWQLSLKRDGSVKAQSELHPLVKLTDAGPAVQPRLGAALAVAGDLNGDGIPDVVVESLTNPDSAEFVSLLLGSDASVVGAFMNPMAGDDMVAGSVGQAMAAIGDLDGDGFPDIVMSTRRSGDESVVRQALVVASMGRTGLVRSFQTLGLSGLFDLATIRDLASGGLASVGDLNGDGVADLVVGAPGDHDGRGAVWFVLLDPEGSVIHMRKVNAPVESGNDVQLKARFGEAVAFLGDLDGNGLVEIAVGGPQQSGRGAVWILEPTGSFLQEAEPAPAADVFVSGRGERIPNAVPWAGLNDGTFFGEAHLGEAAQTNFFLVANAGDRPVELGGTNSPRLTGMQAKEFEIFQSPEERLDPGQTGQIGVRYAPRSTGQHWATLEFGGPSGLQAITLGGIGRSRYKPPVPIIEVSSRQKISRNRGGFESELTKTEWFGSAVASLGDVNGDGIGDIAVATDPADRSPNRVWVLLLDATGTVIGQSEVLAETKALADLLEAGDTFGEALAGPGDLDGDGIPDLLVTARGDDDDRINGGAVWILYLERNGHPKRWRKLSTEIAAPENLNMSRPDVGRSLALIDFDGDGTQDWLLGPGYAPRDNGRLVGVFLNPDQTVRQTVLIHADKSLGQGKNFGNALAVLGDLDKDGTIEVAVGSRDRAVNGQQKEKIFVLSFDQAGRVTRTRRLSQRNFSTFELVDSDGWRLGWTLAPVGDVNGDGVPDLAIGVAQRPGGGVVWIACLNPAAEIIDLQMLSAPGNNVPSARFGYSIAHVPAGGGTGLGRLVVGANEQAEERIACGSVWVLDLLAAVRNNEPKAIPSSTRPPGRSRILSWGRNWRNVLGIPGDYRKLPGELPLDGVLAVDLELHCLARMKDGSIKAWGNNNQGQLGDGSRSNAITPVNVIFPKGAPRMIKAVAGNGCSLSLDVTGDVWGWGDDGQQQLFGLGDQSQPVKLGYFDSKPFIDIAVNNWTLLALERQGRVWQWSGNYKNSIQGALRGRKGVAGSALFHEQHVCHSAFFASKNKSPGGYHHREVY